MKIFLLDVIEEPRVANSDNSIWLLVISLAALVGLVALFIYRRKKQKSS